MDTKNILKEKKIYYWILVAIVVIGAVLLALRFNTAAASNANTETTGSVVSMTMSTTVDASGSLAAQPSATLTWNTGGVVQEVYVKAGDQVREGDVLMKLKTTSVSS